MSKKKKKTKKNKKTNRVWYPCGPFFSLFFFFLFHLSFFFFPRSHPMRAMRAVGYNERAILPSPSDFAITFTRPRECAGARISKTRISLTRARRVT